MSKSYYIQKSTCTHTVTNQGCNWCEITTECGHVYTVAEGSMDITDNWIVCPYCAKEYITNE